MSAQDWVDKDFYKVLGVSKDATDKDIKKAFRKLARQNHPDQHPGDAAAEARFKEISEANSVLSNPDSRREYAEIREMVANGGFRYGPGAGYPGAGGQYAYGNPAGGPYTYSYSTGGSAEDLFGQGAGYEDILGGLFGQGGARRPSGPRKGADIEGEVTIGFLEAVKGTTVSMQLVSEVACTACGGAGITSGNPPQVCGSCHGTARVRQAKTMKVRIPASVDDGQTIRIKGKGSAGLNGGPAGDLLVRVHVTPHPLFGRKGRDLTASVPVTVDELILGADIEVPTLEGGRVKVRIPECTPNRRTLRVRGKGVTTKAGTGDLLVTVEVVMPTSLNDQAKQAMRDFAHAMGQTNPRASILGRN
ncbi:MAG: DnaJ domain-containing protein [Acidipropionibacterium jensenii]|nr:DnaJ domain-containing protein [Acidipropionibacterium jensenii]